MNDNCCLFAFALPIQFADGNCQSEWPMSVANGNSRFHLPMSFADGNCRSEQPMLVADVDCRSEQPIASCQSLWPILVPLLSISSSFLAQYSSLILVFDQQKRQARRCICSRATPSLSSRGRKERKSRSLAPSTNIRSRSRSHSLSRRRTRSSSPTC